MFGNGTPPPSRLTATAEILGLPIGSVFNLEPIRHLEHLNHYVCNGMTVPTTTAMKLVKLGRMKP